MDKRLRTTLWVLSSLAVLWMVIALIGLARMGAMMGTGMMRRGGTGETMNGMPSPAIHAALMGAG